MFRLSATCPQCGKDFIHRVGHCGVTEQCLALVCVAPFRCQICMHRFLLLQPGQWHVFSTRERRESDRFPVNYQALFTGDRIKGEGTIVNLGAQGGYLQSDACLAIGAPLRLSIQHAEGAPPLEIETAIVRWNLGAWHGFEFQQVAPEQERELRRLLEACWMRARGEARGRSRWGMGVFCLLLGLSAPAFADGPSRTVITKDGARIEGTIVGGSVTVKTTIKTREIEAQLIHALSKGLLKTDDGLTMVGAVTIVSGEVQVETEKGRVVVPALNIDTIQASDMHMTPRHPSGPGAAPGGGVQEPQKMIVGRWQDSSGIAWEFFKDGTVVSGHYNGRFSFVDPHRVKVELGMPVGIALGPVVMPGTQSVRVYDIVDLSGEQLVWEYQGNQVTLQRMP
ncbi:MAG: PilZ domain-containing protein [Nitrospira sp.]|nr:PilZ domain-containing protein [Nitrospira sp.]